MKRTHSRSGICRPDEKSPEDATFSALLKTLPVVQPSKKFDLIAACPAVQTQHGDRSCAAQAVVSAIEFVQKKQNGGPYDNWSRLFVYYNARRGDLCHVKPAHKPKLSLDDLGASLKSAIIAADRFGVCLEKDWPYQEDRAGKPPSEAAYSAAKLHRISRYRLSNDIEELKQCLSSGFPFVFSFKYPVSYPKTPHNKGFVEMPETPPEGDSSTHSAMAVGYDDHARRISFQNSRGTRWGKRGYGSMSYDYITNPELCADLWTITAIEAIAP